MTESFRKHAEEIVDSFKGFISPGLADKIGDEHFDELSMMIESAISASVLSHLEQVVGRFSKLAEQVRKEAERFDAG